MSAARRVKSRRSRSPLWITQCQYRWPLYSLRKYGFTPFQAEPRQIDLENGRQDIFLTGLIGRPTAIDLDKEGNLLVLDASGKRLLKVHPVNGGISVIAENLPIYPTIYSHWPLIGLPNGLAVAENGAIYIGGNDDGSVWKITK